MRLILTYPRSGSHYLNSLLFWHTGMKLEKSHEFQDVDYIITIARNPLDSMRSNITMMKHYGREIASYEEFEKGYVDFYTMLYDKADYVIDYEDLINFPELTALQLCKTLKMAINYHEYIPVIDMPEKRHLAFAKTSPEYENVHLDKNDLKQAYEVYNKLLTKAVTIEKPRYQQLELWT